MKQTSRQRRAKSKLRRMRMSRGLLQKELSKLSGVTQASISKMEKDGIKRADKALDIARALQCTVDEILDDPKPKESRSPRA